VGAVLGPGYDYASKVPPPSALGVSTNGDIGTTYNDINAGITYVGYLTTGPNMGNKYFLQTGAQCTASDTGKQTDLYTYLDQSADQPLLPPALSSSLGGMGGGNGALQGLIPGMVQQLTDLNPIGILESLVRSAYPPCQKVTCPTGDVTQSMSFESQYVLSSDVGALSQSGCTSAASESFAGQQQTSEGTASNALLLGIPLLVLLFASRF
jgi:hypothetical protein